MRVSILMALSVNGFIAREGGEEDFLSHDNWEVMKEYIKEYGNLVWGRATYESVMSWGEEYKKDLEKVNLFIVSTQEHESSKNVTYCKSPKEAIEKIKNLGMEKALISGGARLNSAFLKEGLADELILSYNPVIISKGKGLFNMDISDVDLRLTEVKEMKNNIVHIKYNVSYK